ncbi:hypothetical protein SteCoe_34240 [Stentor coeruleus]|uniref:Ubiquitin-like protease family profile domain-containing protein n=1 Tax=Stentor coeruleus TaxID=5963 RepID=A0A1R2AV17_9CILI|nr:hypothetical protein SteCoe_34240 [Stentor coeruleus]
MDTRSVSSGGKISGSSSYASSNQPKKGLEKIMSKKNLGVASMPFFVQAKPGVAKIRIPNDRPSTPEASSPSPLRLNDSYTILQRQISLAVETNNKKLSFSPTYQEEFNEYVNVLREENATKEVLRILNFVLTAEDFLSFINPGPISYKGIDACLAIFKKKNSEALIRDEAKNNIAISSTSFAWKIFNLAQYDDLHAPTYIMAYDHIIFPIFIGYWTLLVVDTKELIVNYYDIGKSSEYLEGILVNCFRFLQQEIRFHGGPPKDLELIKALRYENSQDHSDLNINDSSIYILLKVKELALLSNQEHLDEDETNVMEFKENLAKSIFEVCERIDA